MFKKKTVVVVGAGASKEANFPLGWELKNAIAAAAQFRFGENGLTTNHDFWGELCRHPEFAHDTKRIRAACSKISHGISFVSSVDSFLEIHGTDPDIQICTKAAIVKLILDGERSSRLSVDQGNIYNQLSPSKLKETWYLELAHILFEKVEASSLEEAFHPVTFISFNYDRCVEWFIFHALKGLYFLDDGKASELVKPLKVYHPYGDVGACGWLGAGEPFGAETRGRLTGICNRIRTFTEKVETSDNYASVREAIARAETIVFLGFSFHPQNMDLLRPQEIDQISKVRQIFGTCDGMSDNDKAAVEDQLGRIFTQQPTTGTNRAPKVHLARLKCAEFMRQYKRSLAVA